MSAADAGEVPIQGFNGGFIVLSLVISVVGTLTALELLRRVTSTTGILNWYALEEGRLR